MRYGSPLSIIMILTVLVFQCSQEDDMPGPAGPEYSVPETYTFEHVSYNGQLQRLSQLSEMKTYMRSAAEGNRLDAARLQAMYANDASRANWARTYDPAKTLRDKTFESVRSRFDAFLDSLARISQSTLEAGPGQAGIATSLDGEKKYLFSGRGLEYAQIIEKGLMGACLYYQATAVYLGEDKMNVDNDLVIPGEGTEMEHHWDEAFGYLGVPADFPANSDGAVFWGSYSLGRDELLNTSATLMDAFLAGRAAISNDDLDRRDAAIPVIRETWELVSVGTALHYLNAAIAHYEDTALRLHALSEAIAFIYALQFNPDKKLSQAAINELLARVGGGQAGLEQMDLYAVTQVAIEDVRTQLADAFDLGGIANKL